MAALATRWDDDWGDWLVRMIEPFYVEFPWLRMLYLEL